MEPISGLAALYEILRRKTDAQSERRSATAPEARHHTAHRATLDELEQQIRGKLRGSQEPLHSPSVKRWVIGSLLSWEMDSRLQNEPRFNALVHNVQMSIDADAALRARFDQVMEQLSR